SEIGERLSQFESILPPKDKNSFQTPLEWTESKKSFLQIPKTISAGGLTTEVVRRMEKMLAERDEEWEAKFLKEKEKWKATSEEKTFHQDDMRPDQTQYISVKPSGKLHEANDYFRCQYPK
ncbi:hypothetical protein Golomagni_03059, partial [Golovinomyces magnicellulatus]